MDERDPLDVIPAELRQVLRDRTGWFLIGGQAVRCFSPYRPSRDVDIGVGSAEALADLFEHLQSSGRVEVLERSVDTIHLHFEGINVSLFVLDLLSEHVIGRRIDVTGVLATKLHAILDRGTRRDFFDLYVVLQTHSLGIAECLAAMREVYGRKVNEPLLLRALTYFDDADREPPLQGEGPEDFGIVKDFFLSRVGNLIVPPTRSLRIQGNVVDVAPVEPES